MKNARLHAIEEKLTADVSQMEAQRVDFHKTIEEQKEEIAAKNKAIADANEQKRIAEDK